MAILLASTIILAGVSIVLFTTLKANEALQTKETRPKTMNITIGVIPGYELSRYAFLSRIAQEDINKYCVEKQLNYRFAFNLSAPVTNSPQALDYTKAFLAKGVTMILGYAWSSHLCSGARAFGYNDTMVLMTPSASGSMYSLRNDTLYHLCVLNTEPMETTLKAMKNRGVKAFLYLYNSGSGGDQYGIQYWKPFVMYNQTLGYSLDYNQTLIYGVESLLDLTLKRAENKVVEMVSKYGASQTAILWLDNAPLLGYSEGYGDKILAKVANYPNLSSVTWYSWAESVEQSAYINLENGAAAKLRLISPVYDQKTNPIYDRLNEQFKQSEEAKMIDDYGQSSQGQELHQSNCNIYDGLWVLSLSAIQTNSTTPSAIKKILPTIASNYVGATGRCTLDDTGARKGADYVFYAYFEVEGRILCLPCGSYGWEKDVFTWDEMLNSGS
jgi:hypothetical protein